MERGYDSARVAVKLLSFSLLLMAAPVSASTADRFALSTALGKSGPIRTMIASQVDAGMRSTNLSRPGARTDPSEAIIPALKAATSNAPHEAIRSTGVLHLVTSPEEKISFPSLQLQRSSTQSTDHSLEKRESRHRGLQMVQKQTFGVDIAASSGDTAHLGPTADGASTQTRDQIQHIVLNGPGATAVPQQLNLSQVLIQNSSQFFLNWESPRGQPGESGKNGANNNQQYDWKKHVHNQPRGGRVEAMSKRQQIAEQEQQQKLVAEVFLLGKEIDSRQQHLAEHQVLRQRLQDLLALQLELLKQLHRLQQEPRAAQPQIISQRMTSTTSSKHSCHLKDFPLADSFARVKQNSRLLLTGPIPVPRLTISLAQPMSGTASGTKEVGHPISHSNVQPFTLPGTLQPLVDYALNATENSGQVVEPTEPQSRSTKEASGSFWSQGQSSTTRRQPQSSSELLVLTHRLGQQDTMQSTTQLLKNPKLLAAPVDPPDQRHREIVNEMLLEVSDRLTRASLWHNSTEAVSRERGRGKKTEEILPSRQGVGADRETTLDTESRHGPSETMVLSDVAVILIDTEEELSNSSHVPVSTSLNPPSDGDRGEQEKPHRSRDSGRPNEIRATENAESKEMNSQTVHDDEKESAELAPEEPKRQVKASLEEDRVDDIHVEKVQYRELRALQKHQEDHLAMLINQVRQQQEELAARSRLLEEQHQELILMREHFIQITARGRLPDAKGTKPSNNVAPEDSSLVVPDSNDKKKESNGEDAAQSKNAPSRHVKRKSVPATRHASVSTQGLAN
uniref:Uncharacterized protein n=1 Tax=Toxoplasma gondii (strain ATCC 50861 / VEG) TaxID=432359 RepID=A0A0F7V342_TOXGV|nr:TPA: hypothetical protein BN1205_075860 [Toxoplasma gondii VEG]